MSIARNTEPLRARLGGWARTRWARACVAAVAALVLLAIVAPYFLDADRYRATISRLIAAQTGRQVTLGKIRAQFLPRVGFSVEDVSMSNPADFAPGEFVAAQQVRGNLAFWPLVLHREYRLSSIELIKPKLTLLEDERGRNNYTFTPGAPPSAPSEASLAPNIELLAQALSSLVQTQPPLAPEANSPPATLQVDDVSLSGAEVVFGRVDARGHITATVDAAGLDAELRHLVLEPFEPREWQADAKLTGTRLTLASWKGPISITGGSVRLRGGDLEASFAVDLGPAARVTGTLGVADVERAVVRFDVKSADVDIDALLAGYSPQPKRAQIAASGPPAAVLAADQGQAPSVGELIAVGHVSADKLRIKPYTAGPLTVDVRMYNDRAEIWPFTLRIEGGSLQATARTDQRQSPERFSVNLEARNIDVAHALNPSKDLRGKFAGSGELDLQLFGSLGEAWKKSLEGQGQFAIRNGRITGFSLAGAAQSLVSAAGMSGDTTFTAITGDLDVRGEHVTSRDVHLNSPRGTLDLRGTSGFDGAIAYDGQVTADFTVAPPPSANADPVSTALGKLLAKNVGKVTVPVSLHGTFAHPELTPGHALLNFPAQAKPNPQKKDPFPNLFQK